MTPTRLREVLHLLRWSQRGLADVLGCSDRLVRMWAQEDAPVPAEVAAWLEALAAPHNSHAPPTAYRRPRGRPFLRRTPSQG